MNARRWLAALALLLSVVLPARAALIGGLRGADGSRLLLTDEQEMCKLPGQADAFVVGETMQISATGCWQRDDETVTIDWHFYGRRYWPVGAINWAPRKPVTPRPQT